MEKPTVIFDKSVVHEIAKLEPTRRDFLWTSILAKYQLVAPPILVLEILENAEKSAAYLPDYIKFMGGVICSATDWLEEPMEIAYRELVLKAPSKFTGGAP